MMVLEAPGLGWTPVWDTTQLTGISPAVTGQAIEAASNILWSLSGRRFGLNQLTIRPCRKDCLGMDWGILTGGQYGWWQLGGMYPRPMFFNGAWYNLTCGSCTTDCSCSFVSEALLPSPVSSITQVKLDGAVMPTASYRVDDYRKLVRIDGKQWPICNDLNKDDTQVGTWSVNVTFGEDVPTIGKMALGELGLEFAKLLSGNKNCMLPKPVQQIVRQGVTTTFLDPNQLFANGRIGLYLCDLFITTVNPHGLHQFSTVYDIDGSDYRITGT